MHTARLVAELPQEILQHILTEFCHQWPFLKSCGLVSHSWLSASRAILFHSVDLTALLAQPDWLPIVVHLPFDVGKFARRITVKEARWIAEACTTRALLLSHFATSVTTLSLSNLIVSNFADFTRAVSTLKELAMLSLDHVQFESNTLDINEAVPPNNLVPRLLETLCFYHTDLGLLFGWLLAHPVVPKVSRLYCGPCETRRAKSIALLYYCNYAMSNLSEIGFRYPDTTLGPYSPYHFFPGIIGYPTLTPPQAKGLGDIYARYEAKYGFSPGANGVLPYPNTIRMMRIHTFFGGKGQGSVIRTIWTPRLLPNVSKGFRGRVIFDVEAMSVREIVEGEMDWAMLEDILASDIFTEMEAVVFLVFSEMCLEGLESLITHRMPRAHVRGIMRFERARGGIIRLIDVL